MPLFTGTAISFLDSLERGAVDISSVQPAQALARHSTGYPLQRQSEPERRLARPGQGRP